MEKVVYNRKTVRKIVMKLISKDMMNSESKYFKGKTQFDISSINRRVKRILDYIDNEDHMLHMFRGRIPNEHIAYFVYNMVMDENIRRKHLLSDSRKETNGMKANYKVINLMAESFENYNMPTEMKKKYKKICSMENLCDYKESENYYYSDESVRFIRDLIKRFLPENKLFFLYKWKYQNETLLKNLEKNIDNGVDEWENELLRKSRVASYMKFLYIMFSESLYSIIIDFHGGYRKGDLDEICRKIDIYKNDVCGIIKSRKDVESADFYNMTPLENILNLKLCQIWDMERKIEYELEKDMKKKIEEGDDCFKELNSFSHQFVSEYEGHRRKLLLELNHGKGTSMPDYEKMEKAINFANLWSMINGKLGNTDDVRLIYIIYHEIIDNNARIGNGLIAKTIVGKLTIDRQIEISEEIFINKKIQRGFFWLLGLQEEYHIYNNIMEICREVLLDVWNIPDDIDRYIMLNDIGIKVEDILMRIT